MKNLIFSIFCALIGLQVTIAQVPNLMSYQAVIWDGNGNLVSEKMVNIKLSILQGSVIGTSVYSETHRVQTNVNGLVSLMIGGGFNLLGKISDINWGSGSYFLKTETDPTGGGNFTVTGTTQLVSVPYALFAGNIQTPNAGLPGQVLKLDELGKPYWAGESFPTVNTISVNSISTTTAISGGNVSSDGGVAITTRGVVWSTNTKPTISLTTKTSNGTGTGTFSSSLTGLSPNTAYYVRAYATNSAGTGYGNEVTFTTSNSSNAMNIPCPGIPTVKDIDGNTYNTVSIGTQCWIQSNLKVSKYKNGDAIPTGLNAGTWRSTTSDAYTIYNNDNENDAIYGKLYNWYAVADNRGLCPNGWHVPTDDEWKTLIIYLGQIVAGGKMKSTGTTYWDSPNTSATNESGFSALPGGSRTSIGNFHSIRSLAFFWSTTEVDTFSATFFNLSYDLGSPSRNFYIYNFKSVGASVRCLKDSTITTNIVKPSINTTQLSAITTNSATSGGNISSDGGSAVTTRGVVWSTNPNPTISLTTKTSNGSGIGAFSSTLTGLSPNTTYYVRAYATNSAGTGYGNEISFTTSTSFVLPTVSTISASSISTTTAISGGNITSDGGSAVSTRGVVWSTSANPTISLTTKTSNESGIGNFSSTLTGLTPNTAYYVRAYATNSAGTGYGNQVIFITNSTTVPSFTVTTSSISAITSTTATSGGNIYSEGGAEITARGVEWSTNPNLTISSKTSNGTGTGTFSSSLTGLSPNTTYYVRAYATTSAGTGYSAVTGYGNQVIFTTSTSFVLPAVSTISASSISTTTAISGGNITSDGGSAVTARGVVWSTSSNPTISLTTKTSNGTGTGTFSSSLTGLTPNTTYYVRAYATNSAGTGYGNELIFITNSTTVTPTVTTISVSSISTTTATSGGNASSDGGSAVTARGVVWSTSSNPTISLTTKTSNGTGTGTFSSSLTGLTPNTTYYVRAYATNSAGTGYGNEITFKTSTLLVLPTVSTVSASSITTNTATSGGNISSDGGSAVTARGVVWSTSSNPTISLTTKTSNGTGIGTFSSSLIGLTPNTTYYVRAYATNSAGTGYGNEVTFKSLASVISSCTVNGANGEILTFSCYNLGAVATSDPYTPRWELNGDYWQWGRKEKAANGPSNGTVGGGNHEVVTVWNRVGAPMGAWSDANKTANDPCPSGFRLPTAEQWESIASTNIKELYFTFSLSYTHYDNGWRIKKSFDDTGGIYLPNAGERNYYDGSLNLCRSCDGYYWSSSYDSVINHGIGFSNFSVGPQISTTGRSIRCIVE